MFYRREHENAEFRRERIFCVFAYFLALREILIFHCREHENAEVNLFILHF